MSKISKKLSKEEIRILTSIILVVTCAYLGIDIHLASLPYIMKYMHTDKTHMQQSVSIFLLGIGLSILLYGPLSDKYGRKPVIRLGLFLAVMASYAAAFTAHIHPFLAMRFLQGVGLGVSLGVGRTVIADILQGDRLASIGSYFTMFVSLSPLLAPALGGYIQHWLGWQANFLFLGTIVGVVMLLYLLISPETNKFKNPRAFSFSGLYQNYKLLLFQPVFLIATILSGIGIAANMAYATISSFILQVEFHLTPVVYGWLMAISGIAGIIGKLIGPFLIKRIGSKQTLNLGLTLILATGIWTLFFLYSQI